MTKDLLILDLLRRSKEFFLSGEDLSKKLKVSRSAVWKGVQSLRRLGYDIEAHPHLGYRLIALANKLYSHDIRYELKTKFMGHAVHAYDELDSTNSMAFILAEGGAKEGVCVFSDYQKHGRGRLGRRWLCPKGKGLLFSIILRPEILPVDVPKITLVCGISIVKIVKKICGRPVGIKWPNDIYWNNRKLGGILTEMSAETDRVNFLVVGIGLNVGHWDHEVPQEQACLEEIAGQEVSRLMLAQSLLRQLEEDYRRFKNGLFGELSKEWEDYSVTSGKRVTATVLGRRIHGVATGIDHEGHLWIRSDNGIQEKISAGNVEHVRKD